MRDYLSVVWDFIVENRIATDEEICLVTKIIGRNREATNKIIYARTGFHDMEQCLACGKGIIDVRTEDEKDEWD